MGLRRVKPSQSDFAWLDALQFGKAELYIFLNLYAKHIAVYTHNA
jgi:hypothetical protein